MKNIRKVFVILVAALLLVGCGSEGGNKGGSDKKKVAFITNTNLGDNSLADVLWRGITKAADEFNLEAKAIELGEDATKQVPTLQELAESGDYEIIMAGTYNLKESIETVAKEFPDQKFLAYDVKLDFSGGDFPNVASFLSAQNEGSFLGGALAALMTVSGHEFTNPDKIVGFVGGAENTAINDFLVGYIEGARYIDKDTKVLFSYIGDFSNSAKGKELTLAQYDQGADIVFGVAGGGGLGVLAASKEANRFSIGVDNDQGTLIAKNDPEAANHILTSVQKNMDITIYEMIRDTLAGKLEFGQHFLVGVKEKGMSLSINETFKKHVPAEIQKQIEDIEAKISSGEIKVSTAIGMSTEEVKAIKDQK